MSFGQQSGMIADGVYDLGRENGAPSYYGENKTPWMADILTAGIVTACVILLISFYSILPGMHEKEKFYNFIWITASIFVGCVILVVLYSKEWETATSTSTITKYKAGTGADIKVSIGIHIGLHGVNITLEGEPRSQLNETINYNEEYEWTWRQGRIGFGPFSSEFNQDYRDSQFRGVPLPILWIAEYFTFDGEGIRWGRYYRVAGLYSFMCLWLAFGLWLLTNILCFILLRYAAYCSILTGAFMLTANILKGALRNDLELEIPFSTDHILRLHYGAAFWLCCVTGILCILAGVTVFLMDLRLPVTIATFFGQDPQQDEGLIHKGDSTKPDTSDNSDLLELVIAAGNKTNRPPSAQPSGSDVEHTSKTPEKDDDQNDSPASIKKQTSKTVKFCDLKDSSDRSGSETETTDEEFYQTEQPQPRPRRASIFQRLQKPRRIGSAPQRKDNLTSSPKSLISNLKTRGRVSPTSLVKSDTSSSSDLTDIVEVDAKGNRTVKRALRPPGAPSSSINFKLGSKSPYQDGVLDNQKSALTSSPKSLIIQEPPPKDGGSKNTIANRRR